MDEPSRAERPRRRPTFQVALWLGLGALRAAAQPDPFEDAVSAYSEGRRAEAAALFEQSSTPDLAPEDRSRGLNNACFLFNESGLYERGRENCLVALELRRAQDDPIVVARTLNNLGVSEQWLGRTSSSHGRFAEALAIYEREGDRQGEVLVLGNLASLLQSTGRLREALGRLDLAARRIGDHADQEWAARQAAFTQINRAVVLERLGDHSTALQTLTALLEAPASDARTILYVATNLGVIYRNLGDPVRAEEWFAEALDAARDQGDRSGEINVLLNLGRVELENRARPEPALARFDAGLELARASGEEVAQVDLLLYRGLALERLGRFDDARNSIESALRSAQAAELAEGVWSSLAALADLSLRRGETAVGVDRLREAVAALEEVRGDLGGLGVVADFVADKREVYEGLVEALYRRHAEVGDDSLLREALATARRAKQLGLAEALGLAAPEALPDLAPGRGERLEYLVARGVLYRWRLRGDDLAMSASGPARPVMDSVRRLHRSVRERQSPDPELLRELARLLLPPEWVADPPTAVTLAPDGQLRYLPFGLLPTGSGSLSSIATIVHATSADAARRGGGQGLLAIGAEQSDGGPRLAAVESELEAVRASGLEPQKVLSHEHATPAMLRAELGEAEPALLHVAAHAELDEASGASSAILLSPRDGDSGRLTAAEILDLRSPDLVVLSACSTALGTSRDGYGLESLAGAFLAGGAQTVVASLWDVDDAATAALMAQFYFHLGRGLAAGQALQKAQQTLAESEDWSHPADWSAFVVLGDPSLRVAAARTTFALRLLALASGLALIGWLALRRFR